jgi:hypothetical protein
MLHFIITVSTFYQCLWLIIIWPLTKISCKFSFTVWYCFSLILLCFLHVHWTSCEYIEVVQLLPYQWNNSNNLQFKSNKPQVHSFSIRICTHWFSYSYIQFYNRCVTHTYARKFWTLVHHETEFSCLQQFQQSPMCWPLIQLWNQQHIALQMHMTSKEWQVVLNFWCPANRLQLQLVQQ